MYSPPRSTLLSGLSPTRSPLSARQSPLSSAAGGLSSTFRSTATVHQTVSRPPPSSASILSPTSSTAIRKLTEELEVVRKAWREEGSDLRAKMLELHQAKIRSDERVFQLESELKLRDLRWKEAETKFQHDLRRHDVVTDQVRRQCESDAKDLQSRVDTLTHEVTRLRETIRVLDKRNRSLLVENQTLQSAREVAVAQAAEAEAHNNSTQSQCRDLALQLDQQRKQFEAELTLIRADAESTQRTAGLNIEHKDNEMRRMREEMVEADTRASASDGEVLRLRTQMLQLEAKLGKEVETERRGRVHAEAERSALHQQLTQLKMIVQVNEGELATIVGAVRRMTDEDFI